MLQQCSRSLLEKLGLDEHEQERLYAACEAIKAAGGRPYLVGGTVRDMLLNVPLKDVDIEVHGLSLDSLQAILQQFGHVNLVGKSFGVLLWEHSLIEWVLPRRDAAGRKPVVEIDLTLTVQEALRRRDLTVNAMAIDLFTGELIDPFGGAEDLKRKCARSPDIHFFTEDPLRFYRVMQFIGRFELEPDAELNKVCSTMNIHALSQERIYAEFDKLFLKSQCPSRGIRWLETINRLHDTLPELVATVGLLQHHAFHPEGDVFEHTMQVLDAAAALSYHDDQEKLTILSAALCHDLGKTVMTFIADGRIRNRGHEEVGDELVRALVKRITNNHKRIAAVLKLTHHHMAPGTFIKNNARDNAYRRLALKLAPQATLRQLALLATADKQGRNPTRGAPLHEPNAAVEAFVVRARQLGVLDGPQPPVLTGQDLLGIISSGPQLGQALKMAYDIQVNEGIVDKRVLKKRVLAALGIDKEEQ